MSTAQKILIVDDEPNILLSLEFLLKKNGYEVYIARDGAEALSIAEEQQPHLVILDIMMPKVDGYEVCERIKQKPNGSIAPKIIFLSAKSKEIDIQKGYEAGADLYISKPFSTRNLVKNVKEILAE